MMKQSAMRKIFILVAMAPCLAAATLWAQMPSIGGAMPTQPGADPKQTGAPYQALMNDNPVYGQKDTMVILLEQGFIRDLAINGQTETGLSQLAVTNSSNAYVKSLAKVIIADHQVMDAEVTA
ncbi:MAG TPA: DUF4142 domain-containing protein, partial [Acidobacteriaceae bacterium]|nr:DUF4142 domain-containing protein [Acidobacteriaceae bacterium]